MHEAIKLTMYIGRRCEVTWAVREGTRKAPSGRPQYYPWTIPHLPPRIISKILVITFRIKHFQDFQNIGKPSFHTQVSIYRPFIMGAVFSMPTFPMTNVQGVHQKRLCPTLDTSKQIYF
jgi:hypothetical protein